VRTENIRSYNQMHQKEGKQSGSGAAAANVVRLREAEPPSQIISETHGHFSVCSTLTLQFWRGAPQLPRIASFPQSLYCAKGIHVFPSIGPLNSFAIFLALPDRTYTIHFPSAIYSIRPERQQQRHPQQHLTEASG